MPDDVTCFLPYFGEFGWYVMSHVRRVHTYDAAYKVVCCKRSHASLFPTADDIYCDYEPGGPYPIKPAVKPHHTSMLIDDIQKQVAAKYAGARLTFIHYYHSFRELRQIASAHAGVRFVPMPSVRYGLKVDVAIAPRVIGDCKDYQHWQYVVDNLKANGITVGAVGQSSTSQQLLGIDVQAWDHGDVDSDIELLLNARLVISGDSGMGHLAILCQRPTLILFNPAARYKFLHMMQRQKQADVFVSIMPGEAWSQPSLVLQEVVKYLDIRQHSAHVITNCRSTS